MLTKAGVFSTSLVAGLLMVTACVAPAFGKAPQAQAAAAPEAMTRALGTVKAITGNSLTIATDKGEQIVVSVPEGARILQLAPGSTNLKDAQASTLSGVSVGDRILATGKAGGAGTLTALRVILMKSTAIAERRATEEADWQKRGMGGIVGTVDPATGTLAVLEGTKKIEVHTSGSTIFRRYAGDSVKFEDAVRGTLAQIHSGDQLRARGAKSDDGLSVQADEVVSGSFKNLSGLIKTIDTANGTLTLKDLATRRMMTVKITPNSSVHTLPPQAAMMFAARARGAAAGGGQRRGAGQPEGARTEGTRGEGGMGARGAGNSAGAGLSQLVNRLPPETIANLKVGDAVMVVASESDPASAQVTAITLLSGVEPILQAAPGGSSDMTLSPWDVSGSAPEMGGAQQQ